MGLGGGGQAIGVEEKLRGLDERGSNHQLEEDGRREGRWGSILKIRNHPGYCL